MKVVSKLCSYMSLGRYFLFAGDSKRLLTASADTTVMLWDVETGQKLHTFPFFGPCRSVAFAEGEKMALVSIDPFMGSPSAIHVLDIDTNAAKREFWGML